MGRRRATEEETQAIKPEIARQLREARNKNKEKNTIAKEWYEWIEGKKLVKKILMSNKNIYCQYMGLKKHKKTQELAKKLEADGKMGRPR